MAVRSEHLRPVQKKQDTSREKTRISIFHGKTRAPGTEQDYFDYNLLAVVILLTCFGLVMLYSTSAYESILENSGDDMSYFRKQAIIGAIALVLALIGSQIDYHVIVRYSFLIYFISLGLLFITKFIGREINGARRWIYFGPISFQPAELAKLAIILFLPTVIDKMGHKMKGVKAPALVIFLGGLAAAFTYIFTENLSTALIILGISVILVFIAHPKTAPFVIFGLIIAAAVGVLLLVIANLDIDLDNLDDVNFRILRIRTWLDPNTFLSTDYGYQIMQTLYAIGNGGFFGKGLGNSTQKLGAIPEAQNDMIFSIICEELGVFGAVMVILLFVFMLYRLFFIARNAPDRLGSLIVSGIFIHIALQVVLNIAVVTNLIPTTGITLPFVSYGGTSMLFLMAEMSLALGVSRQIRFR